MYESPNPFQGEITLNTGFAPERRSELVRPEVDQAIEKLKVLTKEIDLEITENGKSLKDETVRPKVLEAMNCVTTIKLLANGHETLNRSREILVDIVKEVRSRELYDKILENRSQRDD